MKKRLLSFMTAISLALGCCPITMADDVSASKPEGRDLVTVKSNFTQTEYTSENMATISAGTNTPVTLYDNEIGTWTAAHDTVLYNHGISYYTEADGVVVKSGQDKFAMLNYYPKNQIDNLKKISVQFETKNAPTVKLLFGITNTNNRYNFVNISKTGATLVAKNGYWNTNQYGWALETLTDTVDGTAWTNNGSTVDTRNIEIEFVDVDTIKYTVGSYTSPEITVAGAATHTSGKPLFSLMTNSSNMGDVQVKWKKADYEYVDETVAEMTSDREAYYRLYDSVGAEIKTDTVLNIAEGSTTQLSGLIKGKADAGTGFVWTSADESVVTVSNGLIKAVGLGETTVKATVDGVEMSVDVKVLGEFGNAVETNTLPTYFADKAAAIARYNACVKANDEADFYAMFSSTATDGLAYIRDLDITKRHSGLSETEIKALGKRLFSYGQVDFTTKEKAETFFNNFNLEIKTGELCAITDENALETAIAGTDFGCNTDIDETSETYNSYYADNRDYVLGVMLAKDDYKNAADVKSVFDKYSIFGSIIENISYSSIGKIIADNKVILGYSADITDSDALGAGVLGNIDTLDTPDKLVNYINDFEAPVAPTSTPTPTKQPNYFGGGGGGGGGSSLVIPEKTPEPVEDENGELVTPEPERVQIFPDVPTDHWAYEGTRYLSGMGAASGYDDGDFRPNGRVTRAEFLKMFMTCQGIEVPELAEDAVGTFADVDITEWYGKYIEAAYSNGLIEGDDDMNANPNGYISRQELAAIVMRAYDKAGKDFVQTAEYIDFTDKDSIAEWAIEAVSRLQLADVINGDENKRFNPLATATRAETAKILYKLIETEPYVAPVETTEAESEVENEN